LFSAIISHGAIPTDFITSTILLIPKVKHVSAVASDNFHGIALSAIMLNYLIILLFADIMRNYVRLNYNLDLNVVVSHTCVPWY